VLERVPISKDVSVYGLLPANRGGLTFQAQQGTTWLLLAIARLSLSLFHFACSWKR
jgi:hypothetical protein